MKYKYYKRFMGSSSESDILGLYRIRIKDNTVWYKSKLKSNKWCMCSELFPGDNARHIAMNPQDYQVIDESEAFAFCL